MTFLRRIFPRQPSRQEVERGYLDQAVSLYDLERRQRDIEHGKFASFQDLATGQTFSLAQP